MSSLKPETKKAIEEAREELKHADMTKFDRALRTLLKIPQKQNHIRRKTAR